MPAHSTCYPTNAPIVIVGKVSIMHSGYRPNVGILLAHKGQLFWGHRIDGKGWQLPQGGIHSREEPRQAMYRELHEEVGLQPEQVHLLGEMDNWLEYRIPESRRVAHDIVGQRQKWFLLQLKSPHDLPQLDMHNSPEFDQWQWVSYWYPLGQVVPFKRAVYRACLNYFAARQKDLLYD